MFVGSKWLKVLNDESLRICNEVGQDIRLHAGHVPTKAVYTGRNLIVRVCLVRDEWEKIREISVGGIDIDFWEDGLNAGSEG
jgi:hypothetical protein